MTFEEVDPVKPRLSGAGWRRPDHAVVLECYMAQLWMKAEVMEVNDLTREVRVKFPRGNARPAHHILDASLYRDAEELFGVRQAAELKGTKLPPIAHNRANASGPSRT